MTTFVCKECPAEFILPDGKDKIVNGHCNECYPKYYRRGVIEQTFVFWVDNLDDLDFGVETNQKKTRIQHEW